MRLPRVAVIADFREENWPSMDLVADMLVSHLRQDYSHLFDVKLVCPPMRRRFSSNGDVGSRFNADRFLNRFWDYPRFLRSVKNQFDLFHLVDHSYGQLLHELPPGRSIVTCHDLDTFQCLLDPVNDPRSLPFRKMMERTLSGFRQAELVTCDSEATRTELLQHELIEPDRTIVVTNGLHPSCSPDPDPVADSEAAKLLGARVAGGVDILHVGSTIPRKRIDLLLRIFAATRERFPNARLLRVGGTFTAEQKQMVERLGLTASILVLPHLERNVLAAIYRRAEVVLLTSEREGFGLPVIEGLACATPVIASDLAVLREVGGDVATYCSVGEIESWRDAIVKLINMKNTSPKAAEAACEAGLKQARKFSWQEHTAKIVSLYQQLGNNF